MSSIRHRQTLRLPEYDYSQGGAYFVTICVQGRECVLGKVQDGEVCLSPLGEIAAESWAWIEAGYPQVSLDVWVVMPNHIHGIIILMTDGRGGSRTAPTTKPKPLGRLIGAFKTISTKRINAMRLAPATRFWQRNFYEHVIRNESSLSRIREYIVNNPLRWELDRENPRRKGEDDFDRWLTSFQGRPDIIDYKLSG